jgi:hypothetical protein
MRSWRRGRVPSLTFEAYGVPVRVIIPGEGLRELVEELLPPGAQTVAHAPQASTFALRSADPGAYEVALDDHPVIGESPLELALETLDQQMRLHIAANARDRIFLHAGVVAADRGAIVLPGPSFSGKTTLVRALLELGTTYFSDEYAVLDCQGQVHPYPRRLSIRGDAGTVSSERHASELGAELGRAPAPVGLVAVVPYRPRAASSWQRISPGRAVAELLSNAVPAQARPRDSLRTLNRAVADATLIEGERGEAHTTAEQLLTELPTTDMAAP